MKTRIPLLAVAAVGAVVTTAVAQSGKAVQAGSPHMPNAPTPEGPGAVSRAPHLPNGFRDTFSSRYISVNGVRLHAVVGGKGPAVLLIHGWPGSWYYWRLVMPVLARHFEVIAIDQRGIGLSDKPEQGYDTGTLANDVVGLMDALGHDQFAVIGVDTGMLIAYALAADHPDRVTRLAVGEAPLPGHYAARLTGPPGPARRPPLAHPLQSTQGNEREASPGTRGQLLRRGVLRLGWNEQAARVHSEVLCGRPRLEPRGASWELPALPCIWNHRGSESGAPDPPVDDARPGYGRSGERGTMAPKR
jgi:pimeloyl-ACP methyl ester carboxylesterase